VIDATLDLIVAPLRTDIDVRDVVLEHLAADECDLRHRLADVVAERDAYRMWFIAALAELREVHLERGRAQQRHLELLDELRRYTRRQVEAA
jgi:hypothetical protein